MSRALSLTRARSLNVCMCTSCAYSSEKCTRTHIWHSLGMHLNPRPTDRLAHKTDSPNGHEQAAKRASERTNEPLARCDTRSKFASKLAGHDVYQFGPSLWRLEELMQQHQQQRNTAAVAINLVCACQKLVWSVVCSLQECSQPAFRLGGTRVGWLAIPYQSRLQAAQHSTQASLPLLCPFASWLVRAFKLALKKLSSASLSFPSLFPSILIEPLPRNRSSLACAKVSSARRLSPKLPIEIKINERARGTNYSACAD